MSAPLVFFREFLRHPTEVASLIPSSRYLKNAIVREADLRDARAVIELGPGSGGTTRALLAAMAPDSKLLSVEINAQLCELLSHIGDARLIAHHGSATNLAAIVETLGFAPPDAVVSGIPFSRLPAEDGRRVIDAVATILAPGSRFVAYQVSNRVAELTRPVLGEARCTRVLRNVPPIHVYRWISPEQGGDPTPAPE